MHFVDILTLRHPDGESSAQQSHCSIRPCPHLRHTSQPDQVSFPGQEEGDCPKHPSDLNLSSPEGEILKMEVGQKREQEVTLKMEEISMKEEEQERTVEEILMMEGGSTKGEEPAL